MPTKTQREKFQKTIYDFYQKNKRDLPWRNTTNPYFILVSEIMLQQTQVSRVLMKYDEFLKTFPTLESLAAAPLSKLLSAWSGLGYNRRAMYLQKTAQKIWDHHDGKFPDDPKILETFPGIGKNTAGSISAFAFNKPTLFIETNIRRVFIHFFFKNSQTIHDNEILPLLEQTLDEKNPREWYYALMDYGNYLAKIVTNPNRKSKHYTKQSPLEGSVRQARGKILKILLENESLTKEELEKKVNLQKDKFEKALGDLLKEKFIFVQKRLIHLVS